MSNISSYTLTLAAEQEVSLSVPKSNFCRCYEGLTPFTVNPEGKVPVELQSGVGIKFDVQFDSIRIKNGATPQTLKLYIGSGDVTDSRLVTQGGVSLIGNAVAVIDVVSVGLAATAVASTNPNRSSILLLNNGPALIYIGFDAGVTPANGMPIGVGSSLQLTAKVAVYAITTIVSELRTLEEGIA